jgi:hypothetical protein
MYDENPNNIWENTDILEQVLTERFKICCVEKESLAAKYTDKFIDLLREMQEELGPIFTSEAGYGDNYEEVLMNYVYILGGEEDGEKIGERIMNDKEKYRQHK